jgi:hypothetical protein
MFCLTTDPCNGTNQPWVETISQNKSFLFQVDLLRHFVTVMKSDKGLTQDLST